MKFFESFLVAFLFLFLFGCSSSSTVIDKDYENQELENKTISIVRLFDSPNISNYDDVTDDLGPGVPEEVYLNFFKERFKATFRNSSFFREISFIDTLPKTKLIEKKLKISNDVQLRVYLPKENSKFNEINSDFVLFLYNLNANRPAGSSGTFMNGMMMGGSFEKLYHQLDFALWDNEKGKLVSYGKVDDESDVLFAMTESNWSSVIRGLAIKILKLSPFKLRF